MSFNSSSTEICTRNNWLIDWYSSLNSLSSFGEQRKFDEMPRRIFRLDCENIMFPFMPASVQVMLMFPWCMGLPFPAHGWWIILLWPAGFSSAKNPFYFSCLLTGLRLVHAGIGITEESSKSFAAKLSVGRQHQTVLVCMLPKASCWCCSTARAKDLIRTHCQRHELSLG